MPPIISDRTWYQTADRSKLVEQGNPEAAYLFAIPGDEINKDDVARYGLEGKAAPAKAAPQTRESAGAEDKARKGPVGVLSSESFAQGAQATASAAADYPSMKMAELKAIALERGLKLPHDAKKEEYVSALVTADENPAGPAADDDDDDETIKAPVVKDRAYFLNLSDSDLIDLQPENFTGDRDALVTFLADEEAAKAANDGTQGDGTNPDGPTE